MVQSCYNKDVGWRTFIVDWIPRWISFFLAFFSIYKVIVIIYHIFFTEEFILKDYFKSRLFLFDLIWYFTVISVWGFLEARKMYRITKKNAFASIDNEKLVLNFGKDSFLWNHVQSVNLEGERKLTVAYTDKGKRKKKLNDLKWLSGKGDFIQNLKENCIENNILYSESDMTFFSRIGLFLRMIVS